MRYLPRKQWERAILCLMALPVLLLAGGVYVSVEAGRSLHACEEALRSHQLTEARRHVRAALTIRPSDAKAHFLAGRIARRLNEDEKAVEHFDRCERLQGKTDDALILERTLLRVQQGDVFPGADEFLSGRLTNAPSERFLIFEALARGHMASMRLMTALRWLNQWLEEEPAAVPALVLRGQVNTRLAQHRSAALDLEKAVALDSENDATRLLYAQSLLEAGRTPESINEFRSILSRHRDEADARLGLACGLSTEGEFEAAARLLDDLLESGLLLPAVAYMERGKIALRDNPRAAETWLRKAAELDPSDRRILHLLAQALKLQGKEAEGQKFQKLADEALADLARLGEIFEEIGKRPHDPELFHEMGVLYLRHGQGRKALSAFHQALGLNGEHAATHRVLADYYASIGDSQRAELHRSSIP